MISIREHDHDLLTRALARLTAKQDKTPEERVAIYAIDCTLLGAASLMQAAPYPPDRIVIPGKVQLCMKPGRFGHPCYELKDHDGGCQ